MDLEEDWQRKCRIELETARLLLRPLIAADAGWLADLLCDAEVCEFLWDAASAPAEARRIAESIVAVDLTHSRFGHWAIQDKRTGEIHGWTELGKLRPWWGPSDEIALSYVIRRASWRKGIATEAAGRLLRHALEEEHLPRVMAVIVAGNVASQRVLEKLGMSFVAKADAEGKNLLFFSVDPPNW